jgi:hypothetical protein
LTAIGLLGTAVLATAAPAAPAHAATAADCISGVKVIGVRGSGETPKPAGATAQAVMQAIAEIKPASVAAVNIGVGYPAVPMTISDWRKVGFLPFYMASKSTGAKELTNFLNSVSHCKDERYIIVGFSQGAHAVGDTFSSSDGSVRLDVLGRIAAVILIADPRFNSQESYSFGSFQMGRNGIAGARSPGDLWQIDGKVRAYCDGKDLVCQGYSGYDGSVHNGTRYAQTYRNDMIDFLRGRLGWPAPAAPAPTSPPAAPAPAPTPSAAPRPSSPSPTPPPAAPASAGITVNTCNTYGNCTEWNPIWVHSSPGVSSRIADVSNGTGLTARCWANGRQLTDGSNNTNEDDARQFTSTLWYGVDWAGGRGYVPAVWTTKRQDTLGLPPC